MFLLIITMLYTARKGGEKARFLIFTIKRYRSCANIDASGLTLKYWHISMDRRILITKYVAFVNNAVANCYALVLHTLVRHISGELI